METNLVSKKLKIQKKVKLTSNSNIQIINNEEVISSPIHQHQNTLMNEASPLRLLKKNQKNVKELISIMMKGEALESHESELQNIIRILMKDPKLRLNREVLIISKILDETELKRKFVEDSGDAYKMKLIVFCSLFIEYKFCKKGQILFKEGDHGDCFYVVFDGKIRAHKNTNNVFRLNFEEYLLKVNYIYSKGLEDLARKTLKYNKRLFKIKKKHLPYLKQIHFLIKFKLLMSNKSLFKSYVSLFEEFDLNPNDYGLDISSYESFKDKDRDNYFNKMYESLQFRNVKVDLNIKKYIELFKFTEVKKLMTVFDNELLITFTKGKCFGDFALHSPESKRTATLIAEEDCHLGTIKREIYNDFIISEKQKLFSKEIKFLSENFFLGHIPINVFGKKYFFDFVPVEFQKGKSIFELNDPNDYLYFIKEGEIELKVEISIIGFNKMIEYLIKKSGVFKDYSKYIVELDKDLPQSYLNKKRSFNLYLYNSKEIIGVESLLFEIPHFYSTIVKSSLSKLFMIPSKKITSIINVEKYCLTSFENYGKNKMKNLILRMFEIQNVLLNSQKENLELKTNFSFNFNSIYSKVNFLGCQSEQITESPRIISSHYIQPKYYSSLIKSHLVRKYSDEDFSKSKNEFGQSNQEKTNGLMTKKSQIKQKIAHNQSILNENFFKIKRKKKIFPEELKFNSLKKVLPRKLCSVLEKDKSQSIISVVDFSINSRLIHQKSFVEEISEINKLNLQEIKKKYSVEIRNVEKLLNEKAFFKFKERGLSQNLKKIYFSNRIEKRTNNSENSYQNFPPSIKPIRSEFF